MCVRDRHTDVHQLQSRSAGVLSHSTSLLGFWGEDQRWSNVSISPNLHHILRGRAVDILSI